MSQICKQWSTDSIQLKFLPTPNEYNLFTIQKRENERKREK